MWKVGTKFVRKHHQEQGVGVVVAVEGRFIDALFPLTGETLRLSPEAAGIEPLVLAVGDRVVGKDDTPVTIETLVAGVAKLSDGTRKGVRELWPYFEPPTLLNRRAKGELDAVAHIMHRLDGQKLLNYRRRGLMPSLIGGRVELFPHQLGTAAKAIADDDVRWLLADEVGLGKTIVACMITSALVRMGRVERALVIAPDTLTVQWLGELYRKFHQVFVHIDRERIADVRTEFGPEMNPFDVYDRAIVSFELLDEEPGLLASMQSVPPDLVVVDEAHQAVGSKLESLILPIVEATQHALLLTATPFQEEEAGFMRLANALRLPITEADDAKDFGHVSAVTRRDIHALGVRVPTPVDISRGAIRTLDDESDARVAWLVDAIKRWRDNGQKALVFVNDAGRAKRLEKTLTRVTQTRLFTFHEGMNTAQRDIELAQFRISKSPALISSGAGSEGRNFQFCDVLVHVDLPDDPTVLEQRIGRVDRIGRTGDIPIVYFRDETFDLPQVYETVGLFDDASVGATPAMGRLRRAIRQGDVGTKLEAIAAEVKEEIVARPRPWSFGDSHSRTESDAVLAEVPSDMEALIERFCYDAADLLDLDVIEKDGQAVYFFEYGNSVNVDAIPGMEEGSRFLGTFDRSEAVTRDELDFFANGHQLVESLLMQLEDDPRGRVGALHVPRQKFRNLQGVFLLVIEGRDGVGAPRLIPLADARGLSPMALKIEALRLVEGLDRNVAPVPRGQVGALMKKYGRHNEAVEALNPDDLSMALLIVAL